MTSAKAREQAEGVGRRSESRKNPPRDRGKIRAVQPTTVAHDVFISYSSTDRSVADAVCATLESRAIGCWIAPRDVLPGEEYAAALVRALHNSRLMILVFSARANQSPQVLREVERAVSKGLTIIPFRIEDAPPTAAMEYYISTCHWLDALTGPLDRHLESLARTVMQLLARTGDSAPAMPVVAAARPVATSAAPPRPSLWPKLAAGTGALMVALLLLGYFFVNRTSTRAASQTSPMPQPASASKAPNSPPPVAPLVATSPSAGTAKSGDHRPPASASTPTSTRSAPPAPSTSGAVVKVEKPKSAPASVSRSPECARLLERVSLGEADLLTTAERTTVAQCGR